MVRAQECDKALGVRGLTWKSLYQSCCWVVVVTESQGVSQHQTFTLHLPNPGNWGHSGLPTDIASWTKDLHCLPLYWDFKMALQGPSFPQPMGCLVGRERHR
jgi:hypothetical protein